MLLICSVIGDTYSQNCRQRYLYWLVIAKSCAETEEFSVSAQLNEFNLYYSELIIQAILHQRIRAFFPDRP